jgi:two-component system response regulator (stage 0 sporulation protein F)
MLKLLIVDDHKIVRELLEIALGEEYEVKTAGSGAEAMDLASSWEPDGVLTDFWMPGMTGLELFQRFENRELKNKSENKTTKFILCSAYLTPELAREAQGLGFAACISKPFELEELRGNVRKVMA